MPNELLSVQITPKEVKAIAATFTSVPGQVYEEPFDFNANLVELKGRLIVDLHRAVPSFEWPGLSFGPVDAVIALDTFNITIDWHKVFGIPHEVCLEIKDPCGDVILKTCAHFDLGVTKLQLGTGLRIPVTTSVDFESFHFVDDGAGSSGFRLTGTLPLAGELAKLLLTGLIEGAEHQVADFVEKLLRQVFGDGDIAKALIALVKFLFNIVELAIEFVGRAAEAAFAPIDALLHKLFKEKLDITLQKDAVPKHLVLIQKTRTRPEVFVQLATPPTVQISKDGVILEVFQ